jgi:hypothetical protein
MLRWKISFSVVAAMATALLGVAPARAQTTDAKAFCDAALKFDAADEKASDSNGPPPPPVQQQLDAALTEVQSTAPPAIAADVQSIAGIIRNALQGGQDPSLNPTFQQNLLAIGQYRYNSCGYQTAQVTGLEYKFHGLPKTLKASTVAIKFTNQGAEIHEIGIGRLKTTDPVKKSLALPEKKQAKKVDQNIVGGHGFALPGQTSYLFVQLTKPGRYVAACFIPVGTTSLAQLQGGGGGTPHWKQGMYAEFKVKKA